MNETFKQNLIILFVIAPAMSMIVISAMVFATVAAIADEVI